MRFRNVEANGIACFSLQRQLPGTLVHAMGRSAYRAVMPPSAVHAPLEQPAHGRGVGGLDDVMVKSRLPHALDLRFVH